MTDQQLTDPSTPRGATDPLAERTQLAMANTEHYLDAAAYYLEGADRGLAHRQEDLNPETVDAWSPQVRDSIVNLVGCHLDTLRDAATSLDRADDHLREAYRDSMEMTRPPHLTAQSHDQVIDTLTDTIEVTVAVGKARPPLETAIAQLHRDPSSVERISAAREQLGEALPYLNHARTHAASAAGTQLGGDEQVPTSGHSPRPEAPALATNVSRGMSR